MVTAEGEDVTKVLKVWEASETMSTVPFSPQASYMISGGKGLGKSTLAAFIAKLYKKFNKNDRVILLTGVDSLYFPSFVKVINLNKVFPEEDIDISLFKNSLVIFDDWENHPDPEVSRQLERLINLLAQNGRNYHISLLVILHHLNKGLKSSTLLREMDALIIFPEKFDNNIFNTLINHFGLTKNRALEIFNTKSKFVMIRNSSPFFYFVSDENKKYPIK
jgi:hypothetical protein